MYSRKMVQSSKHRVLKVTWERCCDLAWKASRRSLHRDHTSVLARDVQGAKATPNRGRGRQGAQARKNWPPRLHENSQCFVTCQKELKMSGCISEKKSGCISEKKLGCISDPHAEFLCRGTSIFPPRFLQTFHPRLHGDSRPQPWRAVASRRVVSRFVRES